MSQHLSRTDLEALFPEPILVVEEVASRLRRNDVTINRAIKSGELEALDGLGRPWRIARAAVIAWALGETPRSEGRDEIDEARPRPAAHDEAEVARDAAPARPMRVPADAVARRRAMAAKRRAA